jgi:hypothetical protein
MSDEPAQPNNVVSLQDARARGLLSQLGALALPALALSQRVAILLGDRVLAGETIDPHDIDGALGFADAEFAPGTPRHFADVAAFARRYPDLMATAWKLLPASRMRLLSVLDRPELDFLAASPTHRVPGRRKPERVQTMHELDLFSVVCLIPPDLRRPKDLHAADLRHLQGEERVAWLLRLDKLGYMIEEADDRRWLGEIASEARSAAPAARRPAGGRFVAGVHFLAIRRESEDAFAVADWAFATAHRRALQWPTPLPDRDRCPKRIKRG